MVVQFSDERRQKSVNEESGEIKIKKRGRGKGGRGPLEKPEKTIDLAGNSTDYFLEEFIGLCRRQTYI